MAPPDLNSLPPSRSMAASPIQPRAMHGILPSSGRQDSPSPSRRQSTSTSLAAAASMNAADISRRSSTSNRGSPRLPRMLSERRRSQVAMSLNLNDPALPSPGELSTSDRRPSFGQSFSSMSPSQINGRPTVATGDPNHQRHASLGDIHNELEQEQEAQVNRMLQMIREQQLQLDSLRSDLGERRSSQSGTAAAHNTTAIDDLTPGSERSAPFSSIHPAVPSSGAIPFRTARQPSSANRSPALPSHPGRQSSVSSSIDILSPPSPTERQRRNSRGDDCAYYQAETANLTRENQMLRMRIRELEKQVSEMSSLPDNTPATPSNLVSASSMTTEEVVVSSRGNTEVEKS